MVENKQRLSLAIVAIGSLVLGTLVYLLDRDPQRVYLLRDLLHSPLAASPVFGGLGAFLPTFIHTFAFILLSIAALAANKRVVPFITLGWFLLEIAGELAQLPFVARYVVNAMPAWFARVPVLDNASDYFRRGTFDIRDVFSIIGGALAAWLLATWVMRKEDAPVAPVRLNRFSKYRRGMSAVAVLLFGVAGTIGSGGGGGGNGEETTPPSSGKGADGVTIFWLHYGRGFGGGSAVQQTNDGGFIVAGSDTPDPSVSSEIYVLKTDAQGAVQWQKWFGGPGRDVGQSVRQTADGGYIVSACLDCDADSRGFYLLKLDSGGNKVWDQTITGSSLAGAYAVRETLSGSSPDGYVFVGSNASQDVALVKTDTAGNIVWQKSFASSGQEAGWDVGFAVEQTADGGYVIAGDYAGAEMWVIKTDATGAAQWDKRLGPGEAFSVKQTVDGGYILAGRTTVRTFVSPDTIVPADAVVIKIDQNGNETWRKTFGGAEDDEARSVALTLDGGYVIAGKTLSYGPGPVDYNQSWQWEDVFLIKLDANGNTVWQKVKGHRPNSSDGGASVDAVTDGGYIVTGNSNAYPSGTVLLMKTDNKGDTVNLGAEDLTITVPASIGIINFTNAIDIASAGVKGFTLPHDVGATALGILIDVANGISPAAFCNGGGKYSASLDPAGAVAAGSTLAATFADCLNGPSGSQRTLNGDFSLTVADLSGSLGSATYTVATTVNSINVTSSESGGLLMSTTTGNAHFRRQAVSGAFAELSQSNTAPPAALTSSETEGSTKRTRILGPFAISDNVALSGAGAYSLGVANETATVDPGTIAGVLTVTILQPVAGASPADAPSSGSFRITAQDNSRMTATITSSGITLAIDTNADGVDDGSITTSWDFLH